MSGGGTIDNDGGDINIFISGVTGAQGVQGPTGSRGPTGPFGITGLQGVTGSIGITGIQGLQGPTGSQGITGSIGITGTQGITGSIGPTGSRGITGALGPSTSFSTQNTQTVLPVNVTTAVLAQTVTATTGTTAHILSVITVTNSTAAAHIYTTSLLRNGVEQNSADRYNQWISTVQTGTIVSHWIDSGLTPGSNTFDVYIASASATATQSAVNRRLTVIA